MTIEEQFKAKMQAAKEQLVLEQEVYNSNLSVKAKNQLLYLLRSKQEKNDNSKRAHV